MTANLVLQMVRDRDLKKMSGNAFVSEDGTRIFDGSANVEVPAVRVVGRDEVKTAVVGIEDSWRIHETAGTGRLERLRKLANEKRPDVIGNRDQAFVFEELHHLLFTALIGLQKCLLISRDVFCALRIRIGERRIREHGLEPAVAPPLY